MFPTTVQFGTRLASAPSPDDDNEEYENPPVYIGDECSNAAIECNAVKECALGSDETTCGEQAHAKHTCFFAGFCIPNVVDDDEFLPSEVRKEQQPASQDVPRWPLSAGVLQRVGPDRGSRDLRRAGIQRVRSAASLPSDGTVMVSSSPS